MREEEAEIESLRADAQKVQEVALFPVSATEDVELFCRRWKEVAAKIDARRATLETTLSETPSDEYLEGVTELLKVVTTMEALLLSEDVYVTELEEMQETLNKYKRAQQTLDDHRERLSRVNADARDYAGALPGTAPDCRTAPVAAGNRRDGLAQSSLG
ncbi:PREDICTED: uncharacterized protein LOC106817259 [Priapulus caudatus]|uniref:Uncharacterized protein LOC106817259 n=1 Tax=Priapulus caudatus TaxID=37621 RepID=A0ABM1EYY2_PRICU|nr:PREDICTED: uncharacterized protein LOC106817259 [Priapulus caudatus]